MILTDLVKDAVELTRASRGTDAPRVVLRNILGNDSYLVLALTRVRESARRLHVPFANHLLRLLQTAVYGVEIGKGVTLGRGVWFVHTVGTVIGGDARLGDRVLLCGANTIGTAHDDGYPVIEDDVVIGAHACVLGPVRIGKGARIGANAVVLHDVPAGAVAVGTPAVTREKAWPSKRSA